MRFLLNTSGLISLGNCVGCYRFKEDEFEGLFIEHYLLFGKMPVAPDLGKYGLPTTRTIKHRYNLTYNEFLIHLGLPTNKRFTPRKTDEEMLEDLLMIADEVGRAPIADDLIGRDGVCGKGTYNLRFGTWTNALKLAGIKPTWCPVSDDELIDELRRFYNEHGRSPTTRDKLAYGWATFQVRFGGWNSAPTAAGIPHNENIYGTRTVGKDGITYDSISESIIADWMYDNGIKYESHVPYFSKLIADFRVGEKCYIEFFGMARIPEYAERMNIKRSLCRRKGYVLIELFPEDLTRLDEKLSFLKEGGVI